MRDFDAERRKGLFFHNGKQDLLDKHLDLLTWEREASQKILVGGRSNGQKAMEFEQSTGRVDEDSD